MRTKNLHTTFHFTQTKSDGVDLEQWLVGGFNHLEKYEAMGRIIPYIMDNKKRLKPPTRW